LGFTRATMSSACFEQSRSMADHNHHGCQLKFFPVISPRHHLWPSVAWPFRPPVLENS
jgi:hypothetical protein